MLFSESSKKTTAKDFLSSSFFRVCSTIIDFMAQLPVNLLLPIILILFNPTLTILSFYPDSSRRRDNLRRLSTYILRPKVFSCVRKRRRLYPVFHRIS